MRFVLIGGRSIQNLNNFELEDKIFKHLNISNPNILFVPQAAYKDINSAIIKFKNLIKDFLLNKKYTIPVSAGIKYDIPVAKDAPNIPIWKTTINK